MRVAPLYRVILVKIITLSRAPCCPTSRLLVGPVDVEGSRVLRSNVAAGVGPCGDGNRLSNSVKKRQAVGGSGWEAAAVVGGSAVEGRGL